MRLVKFQAFYLDDVPEVWYFEGLCAMESEPDFLLYFTWEHCQCSHRNSGQIPFKSISQTSTRAAPCP